ncbi:hypothetical protein DFR70_12691 [Nocardia tenerifensis]|uniref:Uncharacterized protein n=1 Tax=Nocardia tenerifensis TaxID=228006 RepID=A0A318JSH9_9NOCA|nr:hypothetical protein [Nocardia tenerifensis]PXX53970.1 hypothetical protein DFR70_12691 [Nocardia tenerifensis]
MATTLTESVEARCARYIAENRFLGAEVDNHQQILLRAGSIDTIQMPRLLGELVRQELRRRRLATPTIENHETKFLTFVTRPARRDDPRPVHILSKRFKVQAIRTVQGALIPLPGPADTRRSWLEEPIGTTRPDFDTVVCVVLKAAEALPEVDRS